VPAEQEGIRREVQAGRVRFFIDHLQPGRVILSYLVRAITAGDLNVPQARLFAFYEQEVWSPSASGKLRVEAR
jgi:uncharacterized protein YfaS (alpha-2-macroglobulin family)